jgi:(1->4)-alpha-D-glucan 1-alpha-D-glucosylmutase
LLNTPTDNRIKLALTHHALRARQRYETLFRDGNYQPLAVSGKRAEHLVAFARQRRDSLAVILAPRLYAQLLGDHRRLPLGAEVWDDTCIDLTPLPEAARFNNPLTGAELAAREEEGRRYIRAREALSDFPVALLIGTV